MTLGVSLKNLSKDCIKVIHLNQFDIQSQIQIYIYQYYYQFIGTFKKLFFVVVFLQDVDNKALKVKREKISNPIDNISIQKKSEKRVKVKVVKIKEPIFLPC